MYSHFVSEPQVNTPEERGKRNTTKIECLVWMEATLSGRTLSFISIH